jgi:hypothetical protein
MASFFELLDFRKRLQVTKRYNVIIFLRFLCSYLKFGIYLRCILKLSFFVASIFQVVSIS